MSVKSEMRFSCLIKAEGVGKLESSSGFCMYDIFGLFLQICANCRMKVCHRNFEKPVIVFFAVQTVWGSIFFSVPFPNEQGDEKELSSSWHRAPRFTVASQEEIL